MKTSPIVSSNDIDVARRLIQSATRDNDTDIQIERAGNVDLNLHDLLKPRALASDLLI